MNTRILFRPMPKAPNPKIGPRPCITCGVTFFSEGIHHRMCADCRRNSDVFNGTASVAQRGAKQVAKP